MEQESLLPLIYNASLLISLFLTYTHTLKLQTNNSCTTINNTMIGLSVGLIGILIMLTPWQLTEGIFFDTRSILLAISGLFFGFIPTLIAILITSALRIIEGGGGVWVGTMLIVTSGFIGLVWRFFRNGTLANISWRELLVFGVVVHITFIILMLFLPSIDIALNVISHIALPIVVIFPIVVVLLGSILSKALRTQLALDDRLKNEFLFQSQFNLSNTGIAMTSLDQSWLRVNPYLTKMLGYSEHEYLNLTWDEHTHPEDLDNDLVKFNEMKSGEIETYELDKRFIHKNGSIIFTHLTVSCYRAEGKVEFVINTLLNITERKLAEEKLKLAASVFTHTQEGISITDPYGNIIEVNETFIDITGYSREEILGKNTRILQSDMQSQEFYNKIWESLLKKGYWKGEVWSRRKNDEVYFELTTISAVRDSVGEVSHYVSLFSDITQEKNHQDQLETMAHYDDLTKLPNRILLANRLSQGLRNTQRDHNSLAVLFLDIDGFKTINDTHSHAVGDELLKIVSLRMNKVLRAIDTLARIGGDEFIIILPNLVHVKDCKPILDRLLLTVSDPIIIADLVLEISISIGITLFPQDNVNGDILIRHADQAMYQAKKIG
jgi:diguanylate cyclase (GGDEF)-like protein/PAS domain S-box-containing protein